MTNLITIDDIYEAGFQSHICELAELRNWIYYHSYSSRRSVKGFPDLVLVRPPRVIFAELKRRDRDKPTVEQEIWLADLRACPGVEAYLWRPSDWDEIERVLM